MRDPVFVELGSCTGHAPGTAETALPPGPGPIGADGATTAPKPSHYQRRR